MVGPAESARATRQVPKMARIGMASPQHEDLFGLPIFNAIEGRKLQRSAGQNAPTARFTSSYSSRWPAAEKCASPGMKYLALAASAGSWKNDGNPFTKRTPCSAAHFCQCVTWMLLRSPALTLSG